MRYLLSSLSLLIITLSLMVSGCVSHGEGEKLQLVANLPDAQEGVSYLFNIVADKQPSDVGVRCVIVIPQKAPPGYTLGLPQGIQLTPNGLLKGKPTKSGNYYFSVHAQLLTEPRKYHKETVKRADYTLAVRGFELASTVPEGLQDVTYSFNLIASKTPSDTKIECELQSGGVLPNGLSLTTSGADAGLLSGTPTESGVFNFTIRAWVSGHPTNYKEQAYKIVINTFEWARAITAASDNCTKPDVAVEPNGKAHAVWLRYVAANNANVLVYASKPETPEIATTDLTVATSEDVKFAAIGVGQVNGIDTASVAWISLGGGTVKVKFATSNDWVGSLQEYGLSSATAEGECDVIYTNDWYVVFTVRNGATNGVFIWQPATSNVSQIASGDNFTAPRIAVDSSGNLIVVVHNSSTYGVKLFVQNDANWDEYEVSTNGVQPDLCVDNDVAHIVWSESVSGTWRVYYRQFANGAFVGDSIDLCEGEKPRIVKSLETNSFYLFFVRSNGTYYLPYWAALMNGAVYHEKALSDYTPPLQSADTDSLAVVARNNELSEKEVLILLQDIEAGNGIIRWSAYTPHAWSYPEEIPPAVSGNQCYYPAMVVAADGTKYALWTEYTGAYPDGENDLFLSINNGSGWSKPINVSNSPTKRSWHVVATLTPTGKLAFVWYEQPAGTNDAQIHYGDYDYTTPGDVYIENIYPSNNYTVWPSIVVGSDGTTHITFRGKNASNIKVVFYTKGGPSNWAVAEQISFKPDGSDPQEASLPRAFGVDENGIVYTVWCEKATTATDKGPYYTDNATGTWANGLYIEDQPNRGGDRGNLVLTGNGKLAMWQSAGKIRWRYHNGTEWLSSVGDISLNAADIFAASDGKRRASLIFTSSTKVVEAIFDIATLSWLCRVISVENQTGSYFKTSYSLDGSLYACWTENYKVKWSRWR